MDKTDIDYFKELLQGIPAHCVNLDQHLQPLLDRPADELDPIELAILRIGAYELMQRPDIPYRVAINEGVELAKAFGAADGHKYVNGVLDKLARQLRSKEMKT